MGLSFKMQRLNVFLTFLLQKILQVVIVPSPSSTMTEYIDICKLFSFHKFNGCPSLIKSILSVEALEAPHHIYTLNTRPGLPSKLAVMSQILLTGLPHEIWFPISTEYWREDNPPCVKLYGDAQTFNCGNRKKDIFDWGGTLNHDSV